MMRKAIGMLLVALVVVGTAVSAAPKRPPSTILFNASPDVETAFGVVRPDGRGRHMLSRAYTARRWSPDGRHIVAYGGPTRLAILDDQGRVLRALKMPDGFLLDTKWSPGGRWLAGFVGRCPEPRFCADLWILRSDGSGGRRLVTGGVLSLGSGSLYEWAPDGRGLAFTGSPDGEAGSTGVVLVSMSGGKVLRPALRGGAEPTWAPNGRLLAFTRIGTAGARDVYVVGRDGSGLRRLTRTGRSFNAVWSPDGKRIAVLQSVGERYAVMVVGAAGGKGTRIGEVRRQARLVWSPDSSRLAWSDYDDRAGTDYVFVARADGQRSPRRLTQGVDPDWR